MGIRITQDSHNKLINFVKAIQDKQYDFTEWTDKLEAIDEAYAKHEINIPSDGEDQPDEVAVKVPVVNSETDAITAYLANIFVNVHPLFPVVSEKGKPEDALKLQSIISRDARQQRWGRQLLKFLSASARYNIGGLEVEKAEQEFTEVENKDDATGFELVSRMSAITKMKALDMYNVLFDYRVDPGDIAFLGEYAGYNEIMSKTELKRLGNLYSKSETAYNLKEAYASSMEGTEHYWNERPDISDIKEESAADKEDWFNWVGITEPKDGRMKLTGSSYFVTRLYVRIIPSEFGISVAGANTPKIIKLTVVNNKWIINYQEIISPLNALPILFSDTREDGFGYQTKSAGENVMPYQQVATELLHTRIKGSSRALNDRAIYDPNHIDVSKVNSTNPSAKIPLKQRLQNAGERPPINSVYFQIPFESQGTQGAIQDLQTVLQIKDQVNGQTAAVRGEQTKGNRTRGEFDTINSNAEGKSLPYAIRIEEQVMIPAKLMIKMNILTSDILEERVLDEQNGEVQTVNIAELRQSMLGFKITDGLLPKSAIKDPEVLSMAMQFVQNSQELNTTHDVGGIFTELMAVLDIDINKHKRPQQPQPGQPNGDPTADPNAPPAADDPGAAQPGAGPVQQ